MTLVAHVIEPPFAGLNTEASPDYLGKGEAPVLRNLLPRPGKAVMRGPLNVVSGDQFADVDCDAMWVRGTDALVSPTGSVTGFSYDATTHAYSAIAIALQPSFTRIGNNVYGVSSGGGLYRWDGGTSLTQYVNLPSGAIKGVKAHVDRLFTFIGANIYYTDQTSGLLVDALTSWEDDVSGLTNQIRLDTRGDTEIGLAKIRDGLVVFYRRSIFMLRGKTTSSFTVDAVSRELGCTDARSICEFGEDVYFMSDQGFMRFDGAQFQNVGGPVHSELLADNDLRVGRFEDDWLLVCNGAKSWLFNAATRVWVEFTTAVGGTFKGSAAMLDRTLLYDGTRIWQVDGEVTQPTRAASATRGFDNRNGIKAAIPAVWQSRLARLNPVLGVQLNRLLVDYVFEGAAGWYVSLVDGRGTALGAEAQMPETTTEQHRSRQAVDRFKESVDVQLRVEWRATGTPPAVEKAELYDAVVQYQPTRQRPNA